MRIILICAALFMGISVSACSIYEIDVQQGNLLDIKAIEKLKIGMNERQVQFLLGSPIIKDPFHPNRWDYVHTFRPGKGEMTQYTITVLFKNNKVTKIDQSGEKFDLLKMPSTTGTVTTPSSGGGGHSH